jgi:hypothetical protein
MKNSLMIFLVAFFSCNSNDSKNLIRQKESIEIIKTIIEEKGIELTRSFPNKQEHPICLNLKKVIVNNKCFDNTKVNNEVKIVKLPDRSFTSNGEVCLEKIYKSRPIRNFFFLTKDSVDVMNQNNAIKAFKITKNITKKFKTVESSKELSVAEKYIQFSIPIFSKDNTKAYLEYDFHTDNNDSFGKSFYLEKVNGKWKIKFIEKNWNT